MESTGHLFSLNVFMGAKVNRINSSRWPRLLAALLVIITGPEAEKLAWGILGESLDLFSSPTFEHWILNGRVATISTVLLFLFCIFWASAIVWCSVIPAWVNNIAVIVGSMIAILPIVEVVLSFHEVASPWRLVGINGLLAAYFALTSWMIHSAKANRDRGGSARDDARVTQVVE